MGRFAVVSARLAARDHRLRGGPLGPGQRVAPASLSTERSAGGLQGPARHLNAALWRASVVVYLPAVRNDGGPPRRVAKLYLPSGGKYFGSREGYGLTYTSCQESGKNGRLWRALGAEIGLDEKTVRRLMKDKAA